jgi:hypothetical protein
MTNRESKTMINGYLNRMLKYGVDMPYQLRLLHRGTRNGWEVRVIIIILPILFFKVVLRLADNAARSKRQKQTIYPSMREGHGRQCVRRIFLRCMEKDR